MPVLKAASRNRSMAAGLRKQERTRQNLPCGRPLNRPADTMGEWLGLGPWSILLGECRGGLEDERRPRGGFTPNVHVDGVEHHGRTL
jgi:hypothetical protein